MYRIGGDGGLLEEPIAIPPVEMISDHHNPHHEYSDPDPAQGLLLTPGERADVVFTPLGDGPVTIEWHDFPRGTHTAFEKDDGGIGLGHDHHDGKAAPRTLVTLKLFGRKKGKEYIPPASLRTIDEIMAEDAKKIVLEFGHTQPNDQGDITFFVQRENGMPLPFDKVNKENAPTVVVGETRIIEVHNLTGGDHNFHLHGFAVQPIETQFVDMDNPDNNYLVPAPHMEDKDTIYIPKRPGMMMRSRTITRLAVVFDDTGREGDVLAYGKDPDEVLGSGGWLMHCHILEHADKGMASFIQVVDEDDAHDHGAH
jgi:FtsP/CotA-like multicopper oxidase with cupredoxin domain